MLVGFSELLKGSNGGFEISRVVGFVGGMGYVGGALAFTAWNMAEGREFDVVAFCASFSGGLALLTGGTAAAVAIKDRNVASAKIIEQTGTVPAPPPAGPRTPVGDPPPVEPVRVDSPE